MRFFLPADTFLSHSLISTPHFCSLGLERLLFVFPLDYDIPIDPIFAMWWNAPFSTLGSEIKLDYIAPYHQSIRVRHKVLASGLEEKKN